MAQKFGIIVNKIVLENKNSLKMIEGFNIIPIAEKIDNTIRFLTPLALLLNDDEHIVPLSGTSEIKTVKELKQLI
jgi:mannitol/fructose-specific phosphotransferase system IIA component